MSEQELVIDVSPDGRLAFVYDDALAELLLDGTPSVVRVSRVEPIVIGPGAGDLVVWSADIGLVGGPVLGPFLSRSSALSAERKWIETNYLNRGGPDAVAAVACPFVDVGRAQAAGG